MGPSGRPVSDRTIERDLRFLLAILNWAAKSRDEEGTLLLESNPLRGLKLPKEKNPTRVLLTQAEYEALLNVSPAVDWRFPRGAWCSPTKRDTASVPSECFDGRTSDLDSRTLRWRGEHEKTGYEHRTPVTVEALSVLEEARRHNPRIGDAPLLPAPKDPSACMSRSLARDWWKKAEELAELEPKRGRGWHSLRRKFASDLMDLPLKVLCELGGWKTAETVLQCYQRPDEDRLRKALEDRSRACLRSN